MPQIVLKYEKQPGKSKQVLRSIASSTARIMWPLIPQRLYLGKILSFNLSLTRICNANCIFCTYQFLDKKDRISMSDEIFDRTIKNIKELQISSVMLSPDLGEPLLASNFLNKIRAIRDAGAKTIQCTTNGIMLRKIGIEKMITDGPDQINISTAGFDEDMYKRVYRSNNYTLMRDNVIDLLKENNRRGRPKTINVWLRADVDIPEVLSAPEMEDVMELANEVCVMSEVDPWNGKIRQDMLPGTLKIQATAPRLTARPCTLLTSITVHPNGNIHACPCRNMGQDSELDLGNIMDEDIFTAYQRLNRIFERWEKGQIPSICRRCYMYNDSAETILGQFKALIKETLRKTDNNL